METSLLNIIKAKANLLLPQIVEMRRRLHMYPELSFQEENTSAWISNQLTQIGIEHKTGIGGHGIVGYIKGISPKLIALRADMDALPIQEQNNVPYQSSVAGVMHACGHDVHTASLLGAAMILNSIKEQLPYSIRLVFQPGEEKLPGGASLMIADGALKNPIPEGIIGQHVYPSMEVGRVGIRSGLYMASADEIYINVKGKGGHGAMPHECNDVVLASSQMIVALQQIISRHGKASIPSVLSFGKVNTEGGATNILPQAIRIEGTFRTMDETWRAEAHQLIKDISFHTCAAYGTTVEVDIQKGYPCLVNDVALTSGVKKCMETYLGTENVIDLDIRMTSEDFAFYSQEVPACFYRLGTGNVSKGITAPVHTPIFDIDEDALSIGMGLMAWLAVNGHSY